MRTRDINRLLKTGNWMIRFDNDGVSYNTGGYSRD